MRLLYLPDISHLLAPDIGRYASENNKLLTVYNNNKTFFPHFLLNSQLESRISSLNLSQVDMVNKTWKFGGNENGYRNIKNLISNFPTCCIVDTQGEPVAWILTYDYCALGILYTLPEHRGKGYAKVLISTMAKKLHAEGYPVYCFIEEDNMASYKLFQNLGFTEDACYRAAWFEFNFEP